MKTFCHQPCLVFRIVPSGFSLILQIHLHPMAFLFGGKGTRDHVLFLIRANNSSLIAAVQCSVFKSWMDAGSFDAVKTLGL